MIWYECDKCSKSRISPAEAYGPGVFRWDDGLQQWMIGRPYVYLTSDHSIQLAIMPTSEFGETFCGECVMRAVIEMIAIMWPPAKMWPEPDRSEHGSEEGSGSTDPSDVLPDVRPGDELPDPSPDDNPEWRKESAEVLAALLGPCKSCGGAPFRDPPDTCNDPAFHSLGRSTWQAGGLQG